MTFVIEDVPVEKTRKRRWERSGGFTATVCSLSVGQSFICDRGYTYAYSGIRQARRRKNNPLIGEFEIIDLGGGTARVGRVG